MKNLLIFLGGLICGVILTIGVLFAIYNSKNTSNYDIKYLQTPINYENKKSTSFKVFQVLGDAALANEISEKKYGWYNGTTVLLLGDQFYCGQIIEIDNPMQVGTYSYQTKETEVLGTTLGGDYVTVPVIETEQDEQTETKAE